MFPQSPGGGIRRLGLRRTGAGLAVASLRAAQGQALGSAV